MMADEHDVKSSRQQESPPDPSRRRFLKGVGIAGAGAALADHLAQTAGAEAKAAEGEAAKVPSAAALTLTLDVNGRRRAVSVEPRTTLLNALRSHLDPP